MFQASTVNEEKCNNCTAPPTNNFHFSLLAFLVTFVAYLFSGQYQHAPTFCHVTKFLWSLHEQSSREWSITTRIRREDLPSPQRHTPARQCTTFPQVQDQGLHFAWSPSASKRSEISKAKKKKRKERNATKIKSAPDKGAGSEIRTEWRTGRTFVLICQERVRSGAGS